MQSGLDLAEAELRALRVGEAAEPGQLGWNWMRVRLPAIGVAVERRHLPSNGESNGYPWILSNDGDLRGG